MNNTTLNSRTKPSLLPASCEVGGPLAVFVREEQEYNGN